MNAKSISILIGLGIAAGCASSPAPKPVAPEVTDASGPVIVRIVGRNETITARASDHGPIYAVQTRDGPQVAPPMTLQQMQARNPDLAQKVKSMNASATGTAWAGVD